MFFLNPYTKSGDETDFIFDIDTTNIGGTSSASDTFILPCGDIGTYNATIDWGDDSFSTITSYNDGDLTHVYSSGGIYTIRVTGSLPHVFFNNTGDELKITDITNWGTSPILSLASSYYGCSNLIISATDVPNLSAVTDASFAFVLVSQTVGATVLSSNDWDVSSITNMSRMFGACKLQPETLDWNTGSVTNMNNMFISNTVANPDVSLWNTESVTDMNSMFGAASGANPDVSLWDVSSVLNFTSMFLSATIATPDVSLWTPTSATSMASMFSNAGSAVPDVSLWDVSSVLNFDSMFRNAVSSNPDVTSWVTTSATDMGSMFLGATLFNQDISGFDIDQVIDMIDILTGTAFSTSNLDLLYNAWVLQSRQTPITFDTDATYTIATSGASRTTIAATPWTINDGGGI
jgi:hypothetical protein